MISGMHVRADWNSWLEDDNRKTITSLCGKRTTRKYAGIPTIRLGQPIVHQPKPTSPRLPGWCPRCMQLFFEQLMSIINNELQRVPIEQAAPLMTIYKNAAIFAAMAINDYLKESHTT